MKFSIKILFILVALSFIPALASAEIKKGDTLQTLSNIHPDMVRRVWYTTNYQQAGLIPACTEIIVQKISKKRMVFTWEGIQLTAAYDKHTKKAGVSFQKAISTYFGPKCDQDKFNSLSGADKEGVESGVPLLGMSREAVIFSMGRPPFHANPNIKARSWMYWRNKFARRSVTFDSKGIVTEIR